MHFDMFYDNNVDLLRGGFWDEPLPADDKRKVIPGNYAKRGSDMVYYTDYYNGTLNSETRIASYVGIIKGDFKNRAKHHYFTLWRTAPTTVNQERQPGGKSQKIKKYGSVFEGYYPYRGMKIVPSWGGSMFEALMVTLFVPESEWGPKSWGVNHPLYVQAQIEHGLFEAQYGYWGFSPSSNPAGKNREYREYGVDAIGMNRDGYYSNNDNTPAESSPPASAYTNGVVTPHAVFLALQFAPDTALQNLANLRRDFKDAYGPYGFYDAINVHTGQVAQYYLALDQGMIMAAIANQLGNNQLQGYFANGDVKRALYPLLREEAFGSGSEAKPHPTGRERK
jgi:hypothetical protein